jgi:hypothetical protein
MTEAKKLHRSVRWGLGGSSGKKTTMKSDEGTVSTAADTEASIPELVKRFVVLGSEGRVRPVFHDLMISGEDFGGIAPATSLTRAASYLLRRSSSSRCPEGGKSSPEGKDDGLTVPEPSTQEDGYRVEDIFATALNRCDCSANLILLREERSVSCPIVIYEGDSESEGQDSCSTLKDSGDHLAHQARFQALQAQEALLGKDHPDVQFLARKIGVSGRTTTTSELIALLESSSVVHPREGEASRRARYLIKSSHMIIPTDYPVQQ